LIITDLNLLRKRAISRYVTTVTTFRLTPVNSNIFYVSLQERSQPIMACRAHRNKGRMPKCPSPQSL
jgi:hypothetical protein